MKNLKFTTFLLLVFALCACQDLDLDQAGDINYETSLGLPVGNITVNVVDVLRNIDSTKISSSTDNNNIYLIVKESKMDVGMKIKDFDAGGISYSSLNFNEIEPFKSWFDQFPTTPFPLSPTDDLTFNDTINYDFDYNELDENIRIVRVDSIQIKEATFSFTLNLTSLNASASNPINISVGFPSITDPSQNRVDGVVTGNTYSFTHTIRNFTQTFPDTANIMPISVSLTIPSGSSLSISNTSAFAYQTKTEVLKFNVLWGYFQSKEPLYDTNVRDTIPTDFFESALVKDSRLLFTNPEVNIRIVNQLGVPVDFTCDSVFAESKNGQKVFASFDGSQSFTESVPCPQEMGDSVVHTLRFNRQFGQTNRLFEITPKLMNYKWIANIAKAPAGEEDITQYFLPMDMRLKLSVQSRIPFELDPTSEINFKDTVDANLDSLLAGISDTLAVNELSINLGIDNMLPTALDLDAIFLDENGAVLYTKDDITINSANIDAEGKSTSPSAQRLSLDFGEDEIENILKTRQISLVVKLRGKDAASKMNLQLTDYLKVHIGLFVNAGINTSLTFN